MTGRLRAALTYSNVVGTLALFVALGGVSYAAVKLPARSVGTKELKSAAVTAAKVRNGTLTRKDFKKGALPKGKPGDPGQDGQPGDAGTAGARGERGAGGLKGERGDDGAPGTAGSDGDDGAKGADGSRGPAGPAGPSGAAGPAGTAGAAGSAGPPGAQGSTGPPGAQGPPGVVATQRISGFISAIAADADVWQFLGSQATVTTNAVQRLTASAMVPIGVSGSPTTVRLDMCFQPSTGAALTPFAGGGYSVVAVTSARISQAAGGTVVPGAGTWRVGACALTAVALDNNDFVNGFVQVTN